jgi:hypothetical protein
MSCVLYVCRKYYEEKLNSTLWDDEPNILFDDYWTPKPFQYVKPDKFPTPWLDRILANIKEEEKEDNRKKANKES